MAILHHVRRRLQDNTKQQHTLVSQALLLQVLPELAAAAREALMEMADGFPLKERLDISKNEKLQGCAQLLHTFTDS